MPRSGLHRILFVRASEETSRTNIFGALESQIDSFLLGASIRRRPERIHPPSSNPAPPRPTAPRPTPPPLPASPALQRPVPPVVSPGFGFDKFGLNKISYVPASDKRQG